MSNAVAEEFRFVIGYPYANNPEALSIYSYFGEIQTGLMEEAKDFLRYVQHQSPGHDWGIYTVKLEKIA